MRKALLVLGAISLLASPTLAQTARQNGAATGGEVAGRVGAVVGGIVGSAVGILTDDDRPRFRHYVAERHVSPYAYNGDIVVGTTLPNEGVEYYEAPSEYRVAQYRYTVVNGHTVLVDPITHRIVEVID